MYISALQVSVGHLFVIKRVIFFYTDKCPELCLRN